jgi:hypothetical protein
MTQPRPQPKWVFLIPLVYLVFLALGVEKLNVTAKLVTGRVDGGFENRGLYKQIFIPNSHEYDRILWLGGALGYYGPVYDRNRRNFNDICTWEGFTTQIRRQELNSSVLSSRWNSSFCAPYFCSPNSSVYQFFTFNYTSPWQNHEFGHSGDKEDQIDTLMFTSCLHCSNLWNSSFARIVNYTCERKNDTGEADDDLEPWDHLRVLESFSTVQFPIRFRDRTIPPRKCEIGLVHPRRRCIRGSVACVHKVWHTNVSLICLASPVACNLTFSSVDNIRIQHNSMHLPV